MPPDFLSRVALRTTRDAPDATRGAASLLEGLQPRAGGFFRLFILIQIHSSCRAPPTRASRYLFSERAVANPRDCTLVSRYVNGNRICDAASARRARFTRRAIRIIFVLSRGSRFCPDTESRAKRHPKRRRKDSEKLARPDSDEVTFRSRPRDSRASYSGETSRRDAYPILTKLDPSCGGSIGGRRPFQISS